MSTIHAQGHGFVAGDRIVFGNVLPDTCGIVEGAVYFVLASGLTADDFQFSETDGGTAFTLNEDVTSGAVAKAAEYTAVGAGDVMAPPTDPAAPDSPSIAGVQASGLVRAHVVLAAYTDDATRVRNTEVQMTHSYTDEVTLAGYASAAAATDLITLTGHGLTAGQVVRCKSRNGGDGITLDFGYYVLASGLTADTFKLSESDGGASIDITVDMTDGVFAQTIEAYANWDYAQTLNFPPPATEITVPVVPLAQYAFRARVQDVFGRYSAWSNPVEVGMPAGSDALAAALSDISNDVQDGIITETKITDNAIATRHIQANAITADLLAATLVLASTIMTAESGRRVEIDEFGIRLVDSDESLIVNIPTATDQPVFFKGEIVASKFTAPTSNDLSGAIAMSGDAIITLADGVSAPTVAPTISAPGPDYLTIATPTGSIAAAAGIAYDSGGDSSNGSYWVACDPTVSPYYVAQEFAATAATGTAGRLLRSISATGSITTYTTTAGSTSHVSDTAQAYSGSTNSHIATNITMPSGRDNMKITKVSVYLAGYGGSATCYNVLWSDVSGTGNYVARSASYTAASAAFANGNSSKYDKSLTAPYSVSAGTIYAGVYHSSSGDGIQYDRDDGSGKNTYGGDGSGTSTADFDGTGWGALTTSSKPNVYVTYTYDVDTRLESAPNIGVATDGTYVYTLDNTGVIWKYLRSDGSYVAKSSVQTGIAGTKSKAGMFYDATAGELLVTTTTGTGAGVYPRLVRVNTSTLAVSTSYYDAATGPTFSGTTDTFRGGARLADPLNSNAATYWIATTSAVYAYTFATTVLTNVSNRDFGQSTTMGDGLTHDGTQFRGWDTTSPTKMWKFSAWDWTSASAVYWVCYAWYDITGTTHETAVGPRSSITMRRRERLTVVNPTIPTGAGELPDRVRIYMKPNATDPGAGNFKLQVTDALTSRTLITYDSAGGADGGGTAFPAGTPAEIRSSTTGWSMKGDGTVAIDKGDTGVTKGIKFGSTGDTNLYRSAADTLKTDDALDVAGVLSVGGSAGEIGSSTSFSINNGGTATFSNKNCEWVKIGRLVAIRISFSVTANGSGTSGITITGLGCPAPANTTMLAGDRGGTGVKFIGARFDTAGNIAAVRVLDDSSGVTGALLASGAGYSFNGAYLAAS